MVLFHQEDIVTLIRMEEVCVWIWELEEVQARQGEETEQETEEEKPQEELEEEEEEEELEEELEEEETEGQMAAAGRVYTAGDKGVGAELPQQVRGRLDRYSAARSDGP